MPIGWQRMRAGGLAQLIQSLGLCLPLSFSLLLSVHDSCKIQVFTKITLIITIIAQFLAHKKNNKFSFVFHRVVYFVSL